MTPRPRRVALVAAGLAVTLFAANPGGAGHEFPFYASYYPQEITLSVLPPAAAPPKFAVGALHAYLGADPFAGRPVPSTIASAESLAAYVLVTLNPATRLPGDASARCLATRSVAEALGAAPGSRAYPYPATPYHPDYLQHADLATAASAAPRAPWTGAPLRVRAIVDRAAGLVPPALRAP